jgi:hypothetical protein
VVVANRTKGRHLTLAVPFLCVSYAQEQNKAAMK